MCWWDWRRVMEGMEDGDGALVNFARKTVYFLWETIAPPRTCGMLHLVNEKRLCKGFRFGWKGVGMER